MAVSSSQKNYDFYFLIVFKITRRNFLCVFTFWLYDDSDVKGLQIVVDIDDGCLLDDVAFVLAFYFQNTHFNAFLVCP